MNIVNNLGVLRARYASALVELEAARQALQEAQQQEARRQAFAHFQHGDCNWCGTDNRRTYPVYQGGKRTDLSICCDCGQAGGVLRPPMVGVLDAAA